MQPLSYALAFTIACAHGVVAQDQTATSPELYRQATTELKDAITLGDGKAAALTLNYFISASGDIAGLEVAAINGVQRGFCTPTCFTRRGPPKKTFCVVPDGCPGAGNGGNDPSPVLMENPILLEFTLGTAIPGGSDFPLGIQLQQLGEEQARSFSTIINITK